MEIEPEIPEGKYLGKLCERGHDWENSGKSLRNKKTYLCTECMRIYQHKRSDPNYNKNWRENNKSKADEYHRIYRATKKGKETLSKRYKKIFEEMPDYYIKNTIRAKIKYTFGIRIKNIPQELIEVERVYVLLKRSLKEKANV